MKIISVSFVIQWAYFTLTSIQLFKCMQQKSFTLQKIFPRKTWVCITQKWYAFSIDVYNIIKNKKTNTLIAIILQEFLRKEGREHKMWIKALIYQQKNSSREKSVVLVKSALHHTLQERQIRLWRTRNKLTLIQNRHCGRELITPIFVLLIVH